MRAAVLAVAVLFASVTARAQEPNVTELEITAITAVASYRAVRARHGEAHEATRERAIDVANATRRLRQVLATGARVDVVVVRSRVATELEDVENRLRELGTRCGGPAVEVLSAEARRDALREAIARLDEGGAYVPEP